nr:immunoglobulin heavy chain junction region [Mus musculus]
CARRGTVQAFVYW